MGGKGSQCVCVWLTTLTTFMCELSGNMGVSTSWNHHVLFRPAQ